MRTVLDNRQMSLLKPQPNLDVIYHRLKLVCILQTIKSEAALERLFNSKYFSSTPVRACTNYSRTIRVSHEDQMSLYFAQV